MPLNQTPFSIVGQSLVLTKERHEGSCNHKVLAVGTAFNYL